jgi:hypothetical protein
MFSPRSAQQTIEHTIFLSDGIYTAWQVANFYLYTDKWSVSL